MVAFHLPANLPFAQAFRRPLVLVSLFTVAVIFLTLVFDARGPHDEPYIVPNSWHHGSTVATTNRPATKNPAVSRRLNHLRRQCSKPDPFEREYGRPNLRMTRGYEGSRFRVERFINKIIRGEPVVVGAIGGSVTRGHGVDESERWMDVLGKMLREAYPKADVTMVNGAIPASGSDYFSFCFGLHIPSNVDLVFIELGVNDEALMEHEDNMDDLLRGLLDLPEEPAVVLMEVAAFSTGAMAGGGGRMHWPIAQYYDVPILNHRWPLVSHFLRFPELTAHYFVGAWWGGTDTRHIGPKGHHDVAHIISSFLRDTTCDMINTNGYVVPPRMKIDGASALPVTDYPKSSYEQQLANLFEGDRAAVNKQVAKLQAQWPTELKQWEHEPNEDDLKNFAIAEGKQMAPGMWTTPYELGRMPRLRGLDGWDPNLEHTVPAFRPQCLSTRATEARFNLTPTETDGWYWWVLDFIPDKPYLVADRPGATVSFELEVNVGIIKIYSLRSKEYGLGKVDCWIDDSIDKKVTVDGYWENEGLNIGRFTTVGEGLSPGKHKITCKLLSESSDPEGRTFFRLISVMGR